MVKIKICGIYREEDACIVNEARPDYFGMILNYPKSHRNISCEEAEKIRTLVNSEIPAVGVFVNADTETILSYTERKIIQIVQLHGQEIPEQIADIKTKTGCPVWKAFKVRSTEDVEKAAKSAADLVILDNGYGTGETFDWSLAKDIGRPFALAGGLTPENLGEAVKLLHPALLDLSSGVETEKHKDRDKVLRAVSMARANT